MTKKGDATIIFLQHKDAIENRLSELYFIKNTYNEFKEKEIINFSYEQFRTLCNKFILGKDKKKNPTTQNKQHNKFSDKSSNKPDPFRRKRSEPIHNPTMTDERRKELF